MILRAADIIRSTSAEAISQTSSEHKSIFLYVDIQCTVHICLLFANSSSLTVITIGSIVGSIEPGRAVERAALVHIQPAPSHLKKKKKTVKLEPLVAVSQK